MGFGLLFLGWTTLLGLRMIPPLNIIGCLVMLKGLTKLETYGFQKAKISCTALLGYHVLYTVLWLLDLTNLFNVFSFSVAVYADALLYPAFLITYALFLYKALGGISKQVEFEKGIKREKSCTSLAIVLAFFLIVQFVFPFIKPLQAYSVYLTFAVTLFQYVWIIFSGIYIYSCYMMIATQEIIDDENKKIREYDQKNAFKKLKNKK